MEFLEGRLHDLKEFAPVRMLKREIEERNFKSSVKRTAIKLIADVEKYGFYTKTPLGSQEREFWVWLKSSNERNVAVNITYTPPPNIRTQRPVLSIIAADFPTDIHKGFPPHEGQREMTAKMEGNHTVFNTSFARLDSWSNNIEFSFNRKSSAQTVSGERNPLSREEQQVFMGELLNAEIDKNATRRAKQAASTPFRFTHYYSEHPIILGDHWVDVVDEMDRNWNELR